MRSARSSAHLDGPLARDRRPRLRQDLQHRSARAEPVAPGEGTSPSSSCSAPSLRRLRSRCAIAWRPPRSKVGYRGDLSELTVSTIHGLCNRVLTQHRHRTRARPQLRNARRTHPAPVHLRALRRDHRARRERPLPWPLEDALDRDRGRARLLRQDHRGTGRSRAAVLPRHDPFLDADRTAPISAYENALFDANRIDFAHLQRIVLDLLDDPSNCERAHARPQVRAGGRVPGHELRPGTAPAEAHGEDAATSASSGTRTRACTGFAAPPCGTSWSSRSVCPAARSSSSRPTTARTATSSSATTAGWRRPTGPTRRGRVLPLRQDHQRLIRTALIRTTRRSSPSGAAINGTRPLGSPTWSSS